jgi:tetratricopeptide (TPR) repeat protein
MRFSGKNEDAIIQEIESDFLDGLEQIPVKEQQSYLEKRVEEIIVAQHETKRRLSVSYTNLGIIHRHRGEFEEASEYYQKAFTLWEDNLTARNNLNILLGRPVEKRNFLEKLFPPDKDY